VISGCECIFTLPLPFTRVWQLGAGYLGTHHVVWEGLEEPSACGSGALRVVDGILRHAKTRKGRRLFCSCARF